MCPTGSAARRDTNGPEGWGRWCARQSMAPISASQHLLGNPEIHLDGDRATGRIMCYNALLLPVEEGDPAVTLLGMWYIDEYVRTPGGWRIAKRGQQRSWAHGLPEALR
ncbi:nuclear transport factor 2 family protein [Nocardia brasiliensis]|uniref:nuclear transport factor 2 family protein n=2 Tax=Nocardia brasiliensis TaxID=37326 RepID=UPI001D00594C|nr:nuclear transport factor 2 family protein [Nocardia brasiliensis]